MGELDFGRRSLKPELRSLAKQRWGGTCGYCGRTPHRLTLDHIVPKSKGGRDVRSNLVAACRRCNDSKGSRPLWDWWQASPWWCETRAQQLAETVLVCPLKAPPLSISASIHDEFLGSSQSILATAEELTGD
jgi:5-methylcytosine-specific restriction endonuclease McrA